MAIALLLLMAALTEDGKPCCVPADYGQDDISVHGHHDQHDNYMQKRMD